MNGNCGPDKTEAELELSRAVDTDPRVIAAEATYNAFFQSSAGRHLSAALRSEETWTLVDEDLKDTLEAFNRNLMTTRHLVRTELRSKLSSGETT